MLEYDGGRRTGEMMPLLTSSKGRMFRTFALWLGLVALTIQGLVPLCAMGPASASGTNSIVICTSHGFETVALDADGNPIEGAPHADHSSCFMCLGCQIGGGFTAVMFVAFAAPANVHRETPHIASAPMLARSAHLSYVSRAPPHGETIAA